MNYLLNQQLRRRWGAESPFLISYAEALGISCSTKRNNRVLRIPATNGSCERQTLKSSASEWTQGFCSRRAGATHHRSISDKCRLPTCGERQGAFSASCVLKRKPIEQLLYSGPLVTRRPWCERQVPLTSRDRRASLRGWRRHGHDTPLLWIVSPSTIELYNGFGRPLAQGDAEANRLHTFKIIASELTALDELAGRLAMESGQFWLRNDSINRKNTVDQRLLSDLSALERDLVADDLERGIAQGLIGRVIFTQYLVDRGIVDKRKLKNIAAKTRCLTPYAIRRLRTRYLHGFAPRSTETCFQPPCQ